MACSLDMLRHYTNLWLFEWAPYGQHVWGIWGRSISIFDTGNTYRFRDQFHTLAAFRRRKGFRYELKLGVGLSQIRFLENLLRTERTKTRLTKEFVTWQYALCIVHLFFIWLGMLASARPVTSGRMWHAVLVKLLAAVVWRNVLGRYILDTAEVLSSSIFRTDLAKCCYLSTNIFTSHSIRE
jgi:hypothetical protein